MSTMNELHMGNCIPHEMSSRPGVYRSEHLIKLLTVIAFSKSLLHFLFFRYKHAPTVFQIPF